MHRALMVWGLGCIAGGAAGLAFQVAVAWAPFPTDLLAPRTAASLTVLDADGAVLRQSATEAGGRQAWVPLDRISRFMIDATLASEDGRFRDHRGVDPVGLVRALWLDLSGGALRYGGSTITMQLVKRLRPDAADRTPGAKLTQMILAARLERAISKDQILEQYLNRVYYGHGAWGVEAAARLYLGKPAAALSVSDAAFLAVLPRGPALYDPYRRPTVVAARRAHILDLLAARGSITAAEHDLAAATPMTVRDERAGFHAPHFVEHVVRQLPDAERTGATIRTTLDSALQERIEIAVREHLRSLSGRGATQAGVVVLRNRDGAVLSWVGSRDWFDDSTSGKVDAVTSRQRPGSTLKPWVYGLAFERGDTPATIAYDIVLPHETRADHAKDVRQHGLARYREALAGSYNLAAVHTLERVGVSALLSRLRSAGLTTLDWSDERYDQSLAIGEAQVRLLDMAAAFSAFGRDGSAITPHPIVSVTAPGAAPAPTEIPSARRVFSPQIAWLVWDVLSDPDARRPMFGDRVPLYLPFAVALKTGTTRAYTDNWALGTTREYTVGVWAGRFDGQPTKTMVSMEGATPLVRATFVALATRFGEPTAPSRPDGLVDGLVCPTSGLAPGPDCPTRKREIFLAGTHPTTPCTWHRREGGRLTTVYPEVARPWARHQGLMPSTPGIPASTSPRTGTSDDLAIVSPRDGARFSLDPHRPATLQTPPLVATPVGANVRWTIDGFPPDRFHATPGEHIVRAELGGTAEQVQIRFD